MFKKIFNPKRKHQEPGKPKITLDQASQIILSRHFSPLPSRAKSPSDVLDIQSSTSATTTTRRKSVSFKSTYKPQFSQSSPDLLSTTEKPYRLTIRNNISPTPPPPPEILDNDQVLLLEASREEKTLVEKELLESKNLEVYRLHQKLLELEHEREHERELMNRKLQDFIEREEQMRNIIQENQYQINQLKYHHYNSAVPSRHNSYKTTSTRSSSWFSDEPEEEDDDDYRPYYRTTKSNHDLYYLYHYYPQYYYHHPQQQYYYHHHYS